MNRSTTLAHFLQVKKEIKKLGNPVVLFPGQVFKFEMDVWPTYDHEAMAWNGYRVHLPPAGQRGWAWTEDGTTFETEAAYVVATEPAVQDAIQRAGQLRAHALARPTQRALWAARAAGRIMGRVADAHHATDEEFVRMVQEGRDAGPEFDRRNLRSDDAGMFSGPRSWGRK